MEHQQRDNPPPRETRAGGAARPHWRERASRILMVGAFALLVGGVFLEAARRGVFSVPQLPEGVSGEAVPGPGTGPDPGSATEESGASSSRRNLASDTAPSADEAELPLLLGSQGRMAAPDSARPGVKTHDPAKDPRRAEPPEPWQPRLSISGRVLDQDGYPIAGEVVTARAESLFDPDADTAVAGEAQWTITNPNGTYSIRSLYNGQYRVSAGESGYAMAELVVRAGVRNADLVLEREQTFRVYGIVTDTAGVPLPGVQVIPNLSPAVPKLSDKKGKYALSVGLRQSTQSLQVRFEREGYEPQAFRLDESEWKSAGGVELDAALVPLTSTTEVSGTLESAEGEPILGEAVVLYSPGLRQRYEALSDDRGEFSLADVAVADDYLLVVRPSGPFQDYTQSNLRIVKDPVDLPIVLNPQESGEFVGRLTDAQGDPIPNFTFMLRGEAAAGRMLRVTGDRKGKYTVDGVPYGGLIFETHSFPYFRITNVQLEPDNDTPLPLVIDWGDHEIRGRVVDNSGAPLPVPNVYIGWSYEGRGMRSTALRRGTADAEGQFRFANLGPGRHTISASAPGFLSAQVDYDVGSVANNITIQLEEAPL